MLINQERFNTYLDAYNELKKRNMSDQAYIFGIPFDDCCCINTYDRLDEERKKTGEWKNTIKCDIPAYKSPITGRIVDGRTERKEELKRNGCREVDPSEFKPEYQNKRFIEKHGIRQ